jgi:hypothetical protein
MIASIGETVTNGIKEIVASNSISTQSTTQSIGDVNIEVHINNEDTEGGLRIGEEIANAFREGISNLSIFK